MASFLKDNTRYHQNNRKWRRWFKGQTRRLMRRLSKRDPENAPRRYEWRGWN